MPRLVLRPLALVVVCMGMARAAPPRFVDRIPADAMIAAHLDLATVKLDALLAQAGPEVEAAMSMARACGLDPPRDLHSVDVAIARSPLRVVVEAHGAASVKQLACLGKTEIAADGSVTLAGVRAADLPGGGVLLTFGPLAARGGAATGLAAELTRAPPASTFALVAALGPPARRYLVAAGVGDGGEAGVRIGFGDAAAAAAFHAWLADALAGAKLGAFQTRQRGRTVEISLGEQGTPSSIAAALALRSAVVEAFRIPAGSMMPTLLVGDHIFAAKGAFARRARRGDVVVFIYPRDRSKDFVKRVVAVAGDKVAMKGDVLVLNGKPVARKTLGPTRTWDLDDANGRWSEREAIAVKETLDGVAYTTLVDPAAPAGDLAEVVVPEGNVFVLGDNRRNSFDSRHWGPVPVADIKGRVAMIWYSQGGPEGVRWERIGALIDEI